MCTKQAESFYSKGRFAGLVQGKLMEIMGAVRVSLSPPLGQLYTRNCEKCYGRYFAIKKKRIKYIPFILETNL